MTMAGRGQRGLSLLEVLITVVLFALLFGVLAQGWFQAAQAQSALSAASVQLRQRQHLAFTLRRLVNESIAAEAPTVRAFTGDARSFSTESSHALAHATGAAPTPVSLSFTGQPLRLTLEAGGRTTLAFDAVFDEAAIDYFDAAGRSYRQWPPELATSVAAQTRPTLLRFTLRLKDQSRPLVILAAPRASGWTLPDETPGMITAKP